MLKSILRQGTRVLFVSKNLSACRGIHHYPACHFNSANNTLVQELLTKHHKELKRYQIVSTMMKTPQKIRKLTYQDVSSYFLYKNRKLIDNGMESFFKPFGEFINHIEVYEVEKTEQMPNKNTPSGSWLRIKFPFQKDSYMRNQFTTRHGGVRIGRLLELLDYIGGACAYKYCRQKIGAGPAIMVNY
jgi:hypothetical protein